jgi:hypothetical protein
MIKIQAKPQVMADDMRLIYWTYVFMIMLDREISPKSNLDIVMTKPGKMICEQPLFLVWLNLKWYRYSGHLEKSVIETILLEVRYDN